MTTSAPTQLEHDSPVVENLLDAAIDSNSRMIVSCLLVGRMIAAADDVITEEEIEVVRERIEGALHLAEPALIEELLDDARRDSYEVDQDLDCVASLTDEFDQYASLHLFAFACEVSAADLEGFSSELPILTMLATTLGIGTRYRDALLYVFCDHSSGTTPDKRTLNDLLEDLHPDRLMTFGVTVHEMALGQSRRIQHLSHSTDQEEPEGQEQSSAVAQPEEGSSVTEETGSDDVGSSTQKKSSLAGSLHDSPTRSMVLKLSDDALEFSNDVLHEAQRKEINRIQDRAADDQFRVSVVGAFSSGKSTMLNALCREVDENLFPTAMIPCTGAVTILRYGEEISYWKRHISDGDEQKINEDDFRDLVELPEQMERVEHLSSDDLDALVVDYPLTLCESGVEVVDSPGLNENPQRTRITEQYLKQSDAVIYVMTVQQLGSLQDREQIEELIDQVGTENLFFVVNCYDQVVDTRNESKVIARAESFFEGVYGDSVDDWFDSRVHFLSALEVVQQTREGKKESRFLKDFSEFEEEVGKYLVDVKGEVRWRMLGDELMEVLARTQGHVQSLVHEASTEASEVEDELEEKKEALRQFERGKQRIRKAEESAEYTIERTAEGVLKEINQSLESLFSKLPSQLEKKAENWTSDAGVFLEKKELQEDFSEQFQDDIATLIEDWSDNDAEPIIARHFEEMIEHLNKDFEEIQEEMNELRSLSDKTFTPPEDDEEGGAFLSFVRGAAGWAAGGPLGAFVGATMDWEDVAVNAAANIGVGLALGFLGVASAGILIPVVAAVGAFQAFLSADKMRNKIRDNVLEGGLENLPKIKEQVIADLNQELEETFDELAEQVTELVERELQEIEEHIKAEIALLEECEGDNEKLKNELQEKKQQAQEVENVARQLETITSHSFDEAVRQTGHSPGLAAAE